jgi:hypothetical protein
VGAEQILTNLEESFKKFGMTAMRRRQIRGRRCSLGTDNCPNMHLRCDECEWETPPEPKVIGQRVYNDAGKLIEERGPNGEPLTRPEAEVLEDHEAPEPVQRWCRITGITPADFDEENFHAPGAKDDSAKLPVELVPPEAIEAIAEIMDFGRKKYSEAGWKKVPHAYRRYMGALLRHAYAILRGEINDPETGKPHIFHLACNAAFMCYFHKRGIACRVFDEKAAERCGDYESANQAKVEAQVAPGGGWYAEEREA